MVKSLRSSNSEYSLLITSIGILLDIGRLEAYRSVNNILVKTYWEIGKIIVEYELASKDCAGYGSNIFDKIASDIRLKYGKGFSRSNLIYMRLLFKKYPKSQTLSDQLSWSHYIELLTIENDFERQFYEKECVLDKWSLRELKRQIDSGLYHRIALSKNKKDILELSKKGNIITNAKDILKDPFIFEFLGLPDINSYTEKEFEKRLIDNMQMFLLELGKGFSFVGRQYKITISNNHFYVDLVFYHRVLKCFVLIDLKIGKVNHQDIGQMNLYLNYFKKEESIKGDTVPIGIILGTDKDKIVVEYALGGLTNKVFVSKYSLYFPNKIELQQRLTNSLTL